MIMNNIKNPIAPDILKTMAYFDVFSYPLSLEQVFQFLPRNSVSREDVSEALDELVSAAVIQRQEGFYCLATGDTRMISERLENERRARTLLRWARTVSFLIKQFPFTRAVFITGSLSKNVATPDSDVDLMIVTAPGRLWICKSMLTMFRKTFLLGSNKFFCTNFYISEKDYSIPSRSVFTAIELVTTKVVWNSAAHERFRAKNDWVRSFLPNSSSASKDPSPVKDARSLFQRTVELIAGLFPLDALDIYLMDVHRRHWEKQYRYIDDAKRSVLFRTSREASSVWKNDHETRVMNEYSEKLRQLGLDGTRG